MAKRKKMVRRPITNELINNNKLVTKMNAIDNWTNNEDLKIQWENYLEATKKLEFSVYDERNNRLKEYLDKTKDEFKQFFNQRYNFTIKENYNRIYAAYHELKFEIYFEEPNYNPMYELGFSIIKNPRIDYTIPILPVEKIILPQLFNNRDEPNEPDYFRSDIQAMLKEQSHWDEIKDKILTIDFSYQCYNSGSKSRNYDRMKKYLSFTELLNEKLNQKF